MVDYTTIIVAVIGSGIFNTLLNYLITMQEKKKNENSGMIQANRLVMKDRLRYLCIQYIEQGWIYEDELEDIIAMHNCYHDDLNGNGFLDSQMRRVNDLEVRGIGVK